ncbi:uncharacterized protein BO96DRAFT_475102 [Aspergillus niger CBS 101883]|uniref:Uncharacterized protein n=2 Tax=Aspergillus niger TaxID=5061 RepID=A2QQA6_ASPNC|nr:uncharacterized protein BO96DRAFT_475102 [Aspergillus niger CBS 101883]XP_059601157.1 hypothetical protein An08g01830 [Aspergillus niger]PYH56237.1 hypothetical protein BO96DRAFT_475102 [Aspergillus niger CBS 101883]CAK39863.1 hypothetical protein An08g01830 [Aspergillus niger]
MDSEECELVYVGKISGRSKRWDDEGSHAGTSQSHTRLGCAQGRGRWADAPIDNECAPPSRWESVGAIDEPDNEDWSLYMYVTLIGDDLLHHAERSPSSSEGGSPTKGIQSITKKGLNSQGIRCHSFPGIKWGRNMNDYYYFDGNGKVC